MSPKKQPETKDAEAPLEQTVERLEAIVKELESGNADLERSIELFQEGRQLGTRALKKLESLERRVQVVIKREDGKLVTEDFENEE